ncbi:MAG: type IV toxin-antitoxin system AbiEi family antitoxin [Mycobacterium sp.]
MFIGSEALRSGRLTRAQLRWNYIAVHPDVYIAKASERTLGVNTRAAALWVPDGVITGRAAAALHGAHFVEDHTPIELIGRSRRARDGVIVREERIDADEVTQMDDLRVSTPTRTALDLARHLPRGEAIARLDALAAATGIHPQDALSLARRYPGARGIRNARAIVPLLDPGAQSPRESWLRMLVIDGGFPRPTTQIMVSDGVRTAFVDMGWEELRIGLEYDGDQHLSDRRQFVKDIGRLEMLGNLDWLVIRVVKEHSRSYILQRVHEAFRRRGGLSLAKSA